MRPTACARNGPGRLRAPWPPGGRGPEAGARAEYGFGEPGEKRWLAVNTMHFRLWFRIVAAIGPALGGASSWSALAAAAQGPSIVVARPADSAVEHYSGRLYVFLTSHQRGEPRWGPNWFQPEPFYGVDVDDFGPGQERVIDDRANGFPGPLAEIPAGKYRAQAVLDRKLDSSNHNFGTGNWASEVVELELGPGAEGPWRLALTKPLGPPQFPQRAGVREVVWASPRLSAFHGREITMRAAVHLPAGYEDQPERRYGVLFFIGGFGTQHWDQARLNLVWDEQLPEEEPLIRVLLSGDCPWGHHVFADGPTNGPRGTAFVEEFLPYLDSQFRTIAQPEARFVAGHSSGGWATLWIMAHWPDRFGAAWSLSPDSVDFRDYQRVNLYADPPESMYRDLAGERRPIARSDGEVRVWYDDFTRMDDVIGQGGQLRSFEAVFSPLDAQGLPRRMYDRQTGEVDPQVVAGWRAYDLGQLLVDRWPQLETALRGKLRIVTGSEDTFYLEGAVRYLAETLGELGSDARVEILEGVSHSSYLTTEFAAEMRREISERLRGASFAARPAEAAGLAADTASGDVRPGFSVLSAAAEPVETP